MSSFAKATVRLNLPILASHSGGGIEEMGWIIFGFDSAELAVIGTIERLLPVWLIEVGLFGGA